MTIDPRIGMWVSIAAALLSFLAASTATLTDIFDPTTAKAVVGWAAFLGGGINAVNAVLHMIPSQTGAAAASQFPLGPKT